jgi:hypothetical protein
VAPIPGSAWRIGLENKGDPRKPDGSTQQLFSEDYPTAGTPLCHIAPNAAVDSYAFDITLSANLNQITCQTEAQARLGGAQPDLINTDLVKKLVMLQNLEAHYVDDANQQRLCLDRAGLLIERHTPQGQTPALTSQDTTAILSNRMTVTADMIYSLDRATDLGLAALAHCVGKDPAKLYQAIDLIGCRYTAQDKKLCQLTDAQLVGAIQFTPTEMEAYSRDHSGFAGPMPGIWQLWTAIRFPATRRNQRFQRRLISSKPPRRTGQSNLT